MARDWNILLVSLLALLCFSANSFSQESSPSQKEVIAIIGTGDIGGPFGPRFAELGYSVVYGSRDPASEKVKSLLETTGHGATATTQEAAAQQGDIVLLAVPWPPMEQVAQNLGNLDGKIVIDVSSTWTQGEDGYPVSRVSQSGAELIQGWNPAAKVVKALGTMSSEVIDDPMFAGGIVTMPIAGNDPEARQRSRQQQPQEGRGPAEAECRRALPDFVGHRAEAAPAEPTV